MLVATWGVHTEGMPGTRFQVNEGQSTDISSIVSGNSSVSVIPIKSSYSLSTVIVLILIASNFVSLKFHPNQRLGPHASSQRVFSCGLQNPDSE